MKRFHLLPVCFVTYPALFFFCGTRVFLLLLSACAIHEAGHFIAIRRAHLRVIRVTLTPCGLDISRQDGCSYLSEAKIALAGPMAGLLGALAAQLCGNPEFCAANLICSVLNLLPVLPLDGGCALRALLLRRFPLEYCDRVMSVVGGAVLFLIYTVSVLLLLYTGWNVSLLLFCAVLFSVCFLS